MSGQSLDPFIWVPGLERTDGGGCSNQLPQVRLKFFVHGCLGHSCGLRPLPGPHGGVHLHLWYGRSL